MRAWTAGRIAISCTSRAGDALGAARRQQLGGEQRRLVAALAADARDQRVCGGIGELVEAALQGGGRRLGIEPGGGDALVAEEAHAGR